MLSVIASKMGMAKHPVARKAVMNSAQCEPADFSENMSPEPEHMLSTTCGNGVRSMGATMITGNLERHAVGHWDAYGHMRPC